MDIKTKASAGVQPRLPIEKERMSQRYVLCTPPKSIRAFTGHDDSTRGLSQELFKISQVDSGWVRVGHRNRMDIDRSARVPGRPVIPPFQGVGELFIRLSLGKPLVNLWQVVKRINTPLIP